MGHAAATVLTMTATALVGLTLMSLVAAGVSTVLSRVRRHLRLQRPSVGFASRVRR